jgi:hypothetical protein
MKKKVIAEEPIKTIGTFAKTNSYLGQKVVCDECNSIFKIEDVEIRPFGDNFNIVNPMIAIKLFVEDGKFISTGDTYSLLKDQIYYTLHCPKCHEVHLFGMDDAE